MQPLHALLRDKRLNPADREFLLVSEKRRINLPQVIQCLRDKIGKVKVIAVRPKRSRRDTALDSLIEEVGKDFNIKDVKHLCDIQNEKADIYVSRSVDFREGLHPEIKGHLRNSGKPILLMTDLGRNNDILDTSQRSFALYNHSLTAVTKVLAGALDIAPVYVLSRNSDHAQALSKLLESGATYFSPKSMDVAAFAAKLVQPNGEGKTFRRTLSRGVVIYLDALDKEAQGSEASAVAVFRDLKERGDRGKVQFPIVYANSALFFRGRSDINGAAALINPRNGAFDVTAAMDPSFGEYLSKNPTIPLDKAESPLVSLERIINATHAAFLVREKYGDNPTGAFDEARKLLPYVFFHMGIDSRTSSPSDLIRKVLMEIGANILHTAVSGKCGPMLDDDTIETASQLIEAWRPNIIYVDIDKEVNPTSPIPEKLKAFFKLAGAFPEPALILAYNSVVTDPRLLEEKVTDAGMHERTKLLRWPVEPVVGRYVQDVWRGLEEGFARRINLEKGLIERTASLCNINPNDIETLLTPRFEWQAGTEPPQPAYQGERMAPGAASGRLYVHLGQASAAQNKGKSVLFYVPDLSAIDLDTFKELRRFAGLVTGNVTRENHYTIALRRLGKPIVKVGSSDFKAEESGEPQSPRRKEYSLGALQFTHRDVISIDGRSGAVYDGKCTLMPPRVTPELLKAQEVPEDVGRFKEMLQQSDDILGALGKKILVNADTIEEMAEARRWGVDSVGLVRTENSLKANDEMRDVFGELVTLIAYGKDERVARVAQKFEYLSASAFKKILVYQDGRFTQIRLLDPALNQILERDDIKSIASRTGISEEEIRRAFETRAHIRGAKLLDGFAQTYDAQVRALLRANAEVRHESGKDPDLHIIVPYVTKSEQPVYVKSFADEVNASEYKGKLKYKIGAMLEVPTGCLMTGAMMARGITEFAIGTNDLTTLLSTDARDQTGISYIVDTDGKLLMNPGVIKFMELMLDHAREGARKAGIGRNYTMGVCGELHSVNLHPKNLGQFIERPEIKYFSAGGALQIPLLKLDISQSFLQIHQDRTI